MPQRSLVLLNSGDVSTVSTCLANSENVAADFEASLTSNLAGDARGLAGIHALRKCGFY